MSGRQNQEKATLAAGCFWCVEAIYRELKGVDKVVSGYSGGENSNPNYEEVGRGNSGHAETIQISFDPNEISYENILEIFWRVHDPTTLNRQGNDVGPQYRSVIFHHDENQRLMAEKSKEKFEKEKLHENPIVTEIVKFDNFYEAEDYHQNYYATNRNKPYCRLIIDPKLAKFRKNFKKDLKE